jgi:hypothetical protein
MCMGAFASRLFTPAAEELLAGFDSLRFGVVVTERFDLLRSRSGQAEKALVMRLSLYTVRNRYQSSGSKVRWFLSI